MAQTDQPCVPCLPEGITFSTQAQIDSFPINYPTCTSIVGLVEINGANITNLNGLSNLNFIGGELRIINADSLIHLTGLENLSSIGGKLSISGNDALVNLNGLNNLILLSGDVDIINNDALINLTGLENLTHINGSLGIQQNSVLSSMDGLASLVTIDGSLGFANNANLSTLTGLEGLTTIGGSLVISGTAMTNLIGLNGITEINGGLVIGDCGGGGGNPLLTSLEGLEGLSSIMGGLGINTNNSLTNLLALQGLTWIGGGLSIENNNSLTTLAGLENIDGNSITLLYMRLNPSLSNCAIESICEFLATPYGQIIIYGNAVGCNSQQEVEDSCGITSVINLIDYDALSPYPNPTSIAITIETQAKGTLVIRNTSGQQLLQQEITEPNTTIDVRGWKSGVYFVRVTGQKNVSVGRFIKQ